MRVDTRTAEPDARHAWTSHCGFRTADSRLGPEHFALRTPHFALSTPDFAVRTPHCERRLSAPPMKSAAPQGPRLTVESPSPTSHRLASRTRDPLPRVPSATTRPPAR